MIFTCSAGKASKNKKDKGPRKFATVINLNDLDEKLDASSLTASASTTTSTTSGELMLHMMMMMLTAFLLHFPEDDDYL